MDKKAKVGLSVHHVYGEGSGQKGKSGFKNKIGLAPKKKEFKKPNYQQNNNQQKKIGKCIVY